MIYMLFEIRNNRFWLSDFQVYHKAAGRIVQGENIYQGEIDGFYRYKYSPTAAIFFIPIGMIPLTLAKILYWVFLSSVICIGFYLALRLIRPRFMMVNPVYVNNLILLAALVLGVNIERELHLGQVNQLLLVSYLVIISLIRDNKIGTAALIWAAGIFLKPFGIILLPYFLATRRFKPVIYFLVFLSIFAVAPAIFTGIDNLAGQYSSWFTELAIELSQKQDLLQAGNHTIFSVLARYTPVRFLAMTPMLAKIYQSIILMLISIVVVFLIRRGRDLENRIILESSFLIGLIPLLSFTSYNAFGFLELALILILFNMPGLSKGQRIFAIAGMVLIGINIHDVVGHKLWVLFNDLSLVAIGAILLLSVLISMRVRGLA
jgi:hypothetical protein